LPDGEKFTVLIHPMALNDISLSPKLVTFAKGPLPTLSKVLLKQLVMYIFPSVEAEAHTLDDVGSNLTLTTLDLCKALFPPISVITVLDIVY
jgi:hypothetical protein